MSADVDRDGVEQGEEMSLSLNNDLLKAISTEMRTCALLLNVAAEKFTAATEHAEGSPLWVAEMKSGMWYFTAANVNSETMNEMGRKLAEQ